METQTTKQNATVRNPMFARQERIGINFLETRTQNESKYFKITGYEPDRENKRGTTNSFWKAVDLETGEEGLIFIDGGLKGCAATIGGPEKLVGKSIELIYRGMVNATVKDENGRELETEINKYDLFFISEKAQ